MARATREKQANDDPRVKMAFDLVVKRLTDAAKTTGETTTDVSFETHLSNEQWTSLTSLLAKEHIVHVGSIDKFDSDSNTTRCILVHTFRVAVPKDKVQASDVKSVETKGLSEHHRKLLSHVLMMLESKGISLDFGDRHVCIPFGDSFEPTDEDDEALRNVLAKLSITMLIESVHQCGEIRSSPPHCQLCKHVTWSHAGHCSWGCKRTIYVFERSGRDSGRRADL